MLSRTKHVGFIQGELCLQWWAREVVMFLENILFVTANKLVYRHKTDFCVTILYPATTKFTVEYRQFSDRIFYICISCHLQTVTVFLLCFQFGFLLLFFFLWLPGLGLSKLGWRKEYESGHPCLVPDFSACVCACSILPDSVTPWTVACQAPLSMGFQARRLEWLPFLPPGDLPDPET